MTHLTSPNQWQQMFTLACYAFQKENPTAAEKANFDMLCQASQNYGLLVNDQVCSQIIATPYTVAYCNQPFSMSGVGYVASYPEARGQGHIRQLFQDYLTEQAEQGVALSYLDPFSSRFYQKFGYTQLFDRSHSEIPGTLFGAIPNEPAGFTARLEWETATSEQKKAIQDIYLATLGQEDGAVQRSAWNWDYRFAHRPNHQLVLCYNDAQEACGYCIYERTKGEPFTIHEFAPLNTFASRKLSSFIASHAASFEQFRFIHSPHQDLRQLLPEYTAWQQSLHRFMMGRILSFPDFVASYPFIHPEETEVWLLDVDDAQVARNHGRWQLTLTPDGECVLTKQANQIPDDAQPKSIDAWTQFFLAPEKIFFPAEEDQEIQKLRSYLPSFHLGLADYF